MSCHLQGGGARSRKRIARGCRSKESAEQSTTEENISSSSEKPCSVNE